MCAVGFEDLQTKYEKTNDVALNEKIKCNIKRMIKRVLHIKTVSSKANYGLLFVFYVQEE